MNDFITIEEAKILTGKSDKTLRRLIGQLSRYPSTQNLVKKDEKGRWLVRSTHLLQESDQVNDQANDQAESSQMSTQAPGQTPSQMSTQTTGQDLAIFQDKVLDIMRAQLEEKDRQIQQLSERLREAHILNRDLQQRLLPGPTTERPDEPQKQAPQPAPQPVREAVKREVPPPPPKKSFWQRLFKSNQ